MSKSIAAAWLMLMAAFLPAMAQDAATPPPPADLRNFEGVWFPQFMPGPPPKASTAPPPKASTATTVPGRDASGASTASVSGSTLECTPIQRLSGAGGGMSNLWIEGPNEIVMISEEDQDVRKFYLRTAHPQHIVPQPNGNSIAHWEGNTLVVDTIGFSNPATGADIGEHTVERFHRDGTKLIDDVTIDTKGQVSHVTYVSNWRPDLRVWQNVCEEGYTRYELINGKVESPDKPDTGAQP